MVSDIPSQSGIRCIDGQVWSQQTVLRIEALSDQQVSSELQRAMQGLSYSWHSINELLRSKFDQGGLQLIPNDGDILFEWINLCDEKREWERKGRLSNNCAEFKRDCLINLMILPFQAGLGLEGKSSPECNWFNLIGLDLELVTTNVDSLTLSAGDLWVGFETRELRSSTDDESESDDNDESLSWVVEDSEYSDGDIYTEHDEYRGNEDEEDDDDDDEKEEEEEEEENNRDGEDEDTEDEVEEEDIENEDTEEEEEEEEEDDDDDDEDGEGGKEEIGDISEEEDKAGEEDDINDLR
jgi:hypothetical protein